jgi:polar amino acid transport system substrate-binding protein
MSKKMLFVSIVLLLVLGTIFSAHAKNKYIVGTSADWPPFEWVDKKGNIVGFDMDVMRMIAHLSGYEIDIKDLPYDSLLPALKAGKIDILAAEINITPERAKQGDFSDPYWMADQAVLVAKDSDLTMATVFSKGHKIGAQTGTTQAKWLEDSAKAGVKIQFKPYETNDLILMDLKVGRVQAFMGDTPAANVFAESWPVRMIGIVVPEYPEVGFVVQQGDPKGLLPMINKGIKKLQDMGVWPVITKAYVSGDLKKITQCYGETRGLLEKGELMEYAQKFKACMTGQ